MSEKKVFTLYAYVRTADDYVDAVPQDAAGFHRFKQMTLDALEGRKVPDVIISEFIDLARKEQIKSDWILAFLSAMEQDLTVKTYETYQDLEKYMYGSAEVVGLAMARILNLPEKSLQAAQLQGKAMQLINFIRDIREDLVFGRVYIPQEDLQKFHITELNEHVDPEQFSALIRFETERYLSLQNKLRADMHTYPVGIEFLYRRPLLCIIGLQDRLFKTL